MTAVLDAWAVLALLLDEPAAARVEQEVIAGAAVCTVSLGEAYYVESRRRPGDVPVMEAIEKLRRRIVTVDPDWPLVRRAARVKAAHPLSYADAFCVATAQHLRAPVWTGDPEILALPAGVVETVDLR